MIPPILWTLPRQGLEMALGGIYGMLTAALQGERAMSSKQSMEDVKAGGSVKQQSNVETEQVMRRIEAVGDVQQLIEFATSNLAALAAELKNLIPQVRAYAPNAVAEIDRLKQAETAANAGDSQGFVSSVKGIARWVGDFAAKVGASLVAKILEKQMGL
jgi:hypothetical protein